MMYSKSQISEFDFLNSPLCGHNIIEASAGTGKTYTISRLFVRYLLEHECKPSSILVVTFTDAATRELRERIYILLRETLHALSNNFSEDPFLREIIKRVDKKKAAETVTDALHSFDTVAIHTIHGFCQRVLFEHAFESGSTFDSSIITDQSNLINEITNDFWRKNIYPQSTIFISYAVESGFNPQMFLNLARLAGKNVHDLRIAPEPEDVDTTADEASYRFLYQSVTSLWTGCRTEILSLLAAGNLKANKYSTVIITEMIQFMDTLCKSATVYLLTYNKFENFTRTCIINQTKKGHVIPTHPLFDLCENLYQNVQTLQKKYVQKTTYLKYRYLHYLGTELLIKKKIRGELYFDDLLFNVYRALRDNKSDFLKEKLRKEYTVAFIDEFQDTDPTQYEIFLSIFSKPIPLFLIGDPKQSIYGFRGADIFTYLHASSKVDSRYTLSRNYRSDPGLLSSLNTLFAVNKNPFIYDQIGYSPALPGNPGTDLALTINGLKQPNLNFIFIDQNATKFQDRSSLISTFNASKISSILNEQSFIGTRKISPSDIAVIVRTNSEAEAIQKALRHLQIPSLIDSGGSVFESNEALEMEMLLAAILEPNRTDRIKAVLSSSLFGFNSLQIDTLSHDQLQFESITQRFIRYHDLWHEHGFIIMFRSFLSQERIRQRLLSLHSGERTLTNVLHCAELLHIEETRVSGMIGLYNWLQEKINDEHAHVPDEEILRLESDIIAVTITTIHKSKGLEYPVVFCPFLCHNSELPSQRRNNPQVFHDADFDNKATLPLGPDEIELYRPKIEKEILAENMRLLYVCLTRAKSSCYVSWGKLGASESSSLAYLLHGAHISEPYVQSLKEKISKLSADEIFSVLHTLSQKNPFIGVENSVNSEPAHFITKPVNEKSLTLPSFNGNIPEQWRVSSFTSLTRKRSTGEIPDHDSVQIHQELSESSEIPEDKSMFTFPAGSISGTFLHEILEKTDFSMFLPDKARGMISERLRYYGFGEFWTDTISDLLTTIFKTNLDTTTNLRLSDIKSEFCLKEVEFFFPLNHITPRKISDLLTDDLPVDLFASDYRADNLEFSPTQGFLKGFIDLVFFWKGKYYLLDWKSNHLGNSINCYDQTYLENEMNRNHYKLQYLLYTVALDRYLNLRDSSYTYNTHFGGVYYLFLRGMKDGSKTGIFYDLPQEKLICRLSELLFYSQQKTENYELRNN